MKVNFNQIRGFLQASNEFIIRCPKEEGVISVLRHMSSRFVPLVDAQIEVEDDIKLSLANTDKNGSILYDSDSNGTRYAFTVENLKTVKKLLRALRAEEKYEVQPFYLDYKFPEDLAPFFKGFFKS